MFSRKSAFLSLIVAVACALPVLGESGDWELGAYAGFAFLDQYDRPGNHEFGLEDEVILGIRGGYWFSRRWSAEGAWQTVGTTTGFPPPMPNVDVDLNEIRVNVLANFNPGGMLRPFFTAGVGHARLNVHGVWDVDDIITNAGGGLRWQLSETFHLRWDARHVWADHRGLGVTQGNLETTLGTTWMFGGRRPDDSDGDGVRDRKDRCPDTLRGVSVDARGCPSDNDDDGVFDEIDRSPDTPRRHTVDDRDRSLDSDGDGVPDRLDACLNTPEGAEVDTTGCPSDRDGDGAYDGLDKCPDTAVGTEVDANGCAILFGEEQDVLVLENVLFEFNSPELTGESKRVLDRIVPPLVQSHAGVRLEVAGHTDSIGPAIYNLDLSQRRARSVVEHLVSAGVDASRLVARGYGEDQPIADNTTVEGRARNRRVELRRLN